MLLYIAFLTGLAGSFHCIGMCGPIAMALPIGSKSTLSVFSSRLFYNLGRIFTYASLGITCSIVGQGMLMVGLQQYLSIFVGISMLIILYANTHFGTIYFSSLNRKLKDVFGEILKTKTASSFLILGLINGLLPCGLVYMALVASVATSSMFEGALFMAFFGLGTAPLMFSVSVLPKYFSISIRQRMNKYLPFYSIFLAIFFIIRGLNLGIPFISPKFEKTNKMQTITTCHTVKSVGIR